MRHDPPADFRQTVVKVLTLDHQMRQQEATEVAAEVSERYLSCVNVGGRDFELLNVTLRWQAFCGGVVEGDIALADGRFAGLPLVGALRWFDRMRYYHQFGAPYSPNREDLDVDHVEAATCMALWKHDAEAMPYWPEDALAVLLEPVNEILRETTFGPIDKGRLREAVDRLKAAHCLTPRAGWYGLREEMRYQVPEE